MSELWEVGVEQSWHLSCAALGQVPEESWVKNPAQAPAPHVAALGCWTDAGLKESRTGALVGTAELKLLEMQGMGKAMLRNWVLTVGNETKWPIMVYFDPKGEIFNFKPILVETC